MTQRVNRSIGVPVVSITSGDSVSSDVGSIVGFNEGLGVMKIPVTTSSYPKSV